METKVLRDTIENKDISPVVMSNTVYHNGEQLDNIITEIKESIPEHKPNIPTVRAATEEEQTLYQNHIDNGDFTFEKFLVTSFIDMVLPSLWFKYNDCLLTFHGIADTPKTTVVPVVYDNWNGGLVCVMYTYDCDYGFVVEFQ